MIVIQLCFGSAENAAMLGIEPTQIGVGGDSAGGNLAAGVAIKARDTGDVNLAFQLLIYPCNDNEMNYESAYKNGDGYGLSTRAMKWFWEQYLCKEVRCQKSICGSSSCERF